MGCAGGKAARTSRDEAAGTAATYGGLEGTMTGTAALPAATDWKAALERLVPSVAQLLHRATGQEPVRMNRPPTPDITPPPPPPPPPPAAARRRPAPGPRARRGRAPGPRPPPRPPPPPRRPPPPPK